MKIILKNSFILLVFVHFFIFGYSQNEININTTQANAYGFENNLLLSNLDSLLKLSYVEKTVSARKTPSKKNTPISDSLVKKKFLKMESFIKLTYNEEVNKFIKFYTDYNQRTKIEVAYGLVSHYELVVEDNLKKYKLPLELKYLPMVGSSFFPAAVSHTGASGIWQLSYPVAKRYGLNITSYTDERRDFEKSTLAAVKYLKEMFDIYHDWNLAITAYFCGAANVNKAISRANGERDVWKIYNFLPQFSREYLPAFIASVYISQNYKDYNIVPFKIKMPEDIENIEVKQKVHFGQISEVLKISMQELKDLNPEYKMGIIQPINDNNILRISSKNIKAFKTLEDTIYKYNATVYFQAPQTVVIPPKVVTSSEKNTEYFEEVVPKNKAKLTYKIKTGDNLGLIAQWYNVSITDIKSWNNLYYKKTIYPGQELVVYVPQYEVSKYKDINSLSFAEKQKSSGKKVVTSTASTEKKTTTQNNNSDIFSSGFEISSSVNNMSNFVYYTVKKGDNLWDISRKFEGTSVEMIIKLNKLPKNYKLNVGQVLKIKVK